MDAGLTFKDGLLKSIQAMRGFAVYLSGSADRADDLVQEALTKAWANQEKFTPGTNLKAWLFTILRNTYYSHLRSRSREVEDVNEAYSASLAVNGEQLAHMDMADMNHALQRLPPEQREALLLISASDMSYEEAASVCGVAVGTIKSRVNRGRAKLAKLLFVEDGNEFGPGPEVEAILNRRTG
jgi:RNA polymerase sigma-70 factor (ECF subfamily)